jgi:AcrR family transcriptional regulator
MAEAAAPTEGNEARRRAMLQAAAELISERGFGETRIADVAKRAGTSSGLVIYYFGTRDRLLVDALRYSEEAFYDAASSLLERQHDFRQRLTMLVEWSCVPQLPGEVSGAWGLWLDLWATALRHPEVREARVELDGRWRDLVEQVVSEGRESGDVGADLDVRRFALTFSVLLDGLATQVALGDAEITSAVAHDIALEYAEQHLGLTPSTPRTPGTRGTPGIRGTRGTEKRRPKSASRR